MPTLFIIHVAISKNPPAPLRLLSDYGMGHFYFNHLETVDLPTFKRSAIFLHDKPSPLSFFACSRLSVLSPHLRCTLSL